MKHKICVHFGIFSNGASTDAFGRVVPMVGGVLELVRTSTGL